MKSIVDGIGTLTKGGLVVKTTEVGECTEFRVISRYFIEVKYGCSKNLPYSNTKHTCKCTFIRN